MKTGKTIRGLLAVLGFFLSSGVLNAQTDITVRGGPNWPDSKSGNGPEKTVDRDPKTYWAGDPNSDKWELILAMKETIDLKNVTVIYFSSAFIPKIAMIYISSDGEKWDEIGLLPSQTPADLAISRKARYMKLEMKGKSSSGNNQPAICEITFNEEIPKNPAELSQTGENLPMSELIYASSVDGTKPLYANVCYLKDGKAKPLIVVMHGVAAERRSMDKDISDFAKHGLFAIAPDMRGRGNSAGKFDCGGLGVYDIVDAINEVIAKFPSEIDAGNINIVGYSGGGGNCFSAFVRFPDLFHVVAPFFGISDYGTWFQLCGDSWNNEMSKAVGGTPAQVPLQYAARNSCLGAANNRNSKLHVFWDESETICPPVMNERFLESYRAAGLSNAVAHISRVTDAVRWIHGGRIQSPMLEKADDLIVNEIRAPVPDLSLPQKGILTVCGYLVTRQFQVFIEDGQRGVVKIEYDLTGKEPEIKVKENPDNLQVKISLRTPPGKDQRP